jgi:aconitate hydratase
VVPLQYKDGDTAETLGLTGEETFSIDSLADEPSSVSVRAVTPDGEVKRFEARVRVDTPTEWEYFRNGGILHYVLRDLAQRSQAVA